MWCRQRLTEVLQAQASFKVELTQEEIGVFS